MKTALKLGFNPLIDCAPIAVAQELGYFKQEGLDVTLEREISWSNIRDKLAYGLIDAAHILTPIPLANSIGIGPSLGELIVPLILNEGGNSFVISNALFEKIGIIDANKEIINDSAKIFFELIKERKKKRLGRVLIGIPFIHSAHNLMLKKWIELGGADAENDVQVLVIPPSKMAQMLEEGVIDGFCAGAPWPQAAHISNKGKILFSDSDFHEAWPEKALCVRGKYSSENHLAVRALTRAIMRGGNWCSNQQNHSELFEILSLNKYLDAPLSAILYSFRNNLKEFNFNPKQIGEPKLDAARWYYSEFEKWGMINSQLDLNTAAKQCFRYDLWQEVAQTLEFIS